MNQMDHLERDLTAWFEDIAVPRTPDYADEILRQTARVRQRPRWTFLGRWLPQSTTALEWVPIKPLPWRTIGLLVALALLLAAGAAAYLGSQQRLPAPFGAAANGLAAYASNGNIFTVDPVTGTRRAIVTDPSTDHAPRWSLDGTRLAFLRKAGVGDALVIADAAGNVITTSDGEPFFDIDTDGIAWSPDRRMIALVAGRPGLRGIHLVDAVDGAVTTLPVAHAGMEVHWRPPDGRQLLFFGGTEADPGLFLYSLDDRGTDEIPMSDADFTGLRPGGWTPDGRSFVFHRGSEQVEENRTDVVDVVTGETIVIHAAFGRLSHDGRRIAAIVRSGVRIWICVADIAGGPCVRIGQDDQAPDPTHFGGLQWSPDDEWVVVHPANGDPVVLLDPDGGDETPPSWPAEGLDSWQRTAP